MSKKSSFLKKLLAASIAAAMTVSSAGTVWAADTYQDVEKSAIAGLAQGLGKYLEGESGEIQDLESVGYGADLTLKLEDGAKSLLGILVPVDVSLFDTLTLTMDMALKEGVEGVDADLLLNGGKLCSLQIFVDLLEGVEYVQIPELVEGYMKADLTSGSMEEAQAAADFLQILGGIYRDPVNVIPESGTVKTLLERYGGIVIDHMQEEEPSEAVVTAGGISEDCTVYEGQMYEADVLAAAEDILTAAKEDDELKVLIDSWSEISGESGDLYTEFQKAVEEGLSELEEGTDDEMDTETFLSSKIYVNEEGKIIARDFSVEGDPENETYISWKKPADGDKEGFFLGMTANMTYTYETEEEGEVQEETTSSFSIEGTGETVDGLLNSEYTLAVDGADAAVIEVTDYDVESGEAGYPNGSVSLVFLADSASSDEESFDLLVNLKFILSFISDESTEESEIVLTLSSADVPLFSLSLGAKPGSDLEIPDLSALSPLYDMNDEEDAEAYEQKVDADTIKKNAVKAGLTEEIVSAIESMLSGDTSEETDIGDEADPAYEDISDEAVID